jgi:alginate production protein
MRRNSQKVKSMKSFRFSGRTGVDAGVTHMFTLPLRPALTAAYAFGSGDSHPDGRTDGAFRQTGLEGNEARWAGITRFKYDGELLDPELSNLAIATLGLGLRPTERSSLDLVAHHYRQATASTALRGTTLAADPSGRSRQLGCELDLVVGYDGVKGLEVTGVLSYFMPGQAFPQADGSVFARVKVEWQW